MVTSRHAARRAVVIQALFAVAGGVQLSAQDLPGLRGWVSSLDSLRPWIASARAAIVNAPGEGDDRLTRLVALQTRMGDLAGARATARALGQSYRPFLAIAKQQLSIGTVGDAIETCNLAPSVEARSTALRHLGELLANGEDWRPVARAIVDSSERAAVFQAAARQLHSRGERQRAREALAEAGRLVTGDTTVRGREVTGSIASELAAVGDLAGALTLVARAPTREARIAWLGQVAAGVRSPIDRPYEISDSLFHVAFATVDSLPEPDRRIWRDSLARAQRPRRFDPLIREEDHVRHGAGSEVMAAVATLAAKGESRRAVEAIVKRLEYRRTGRRATAEVEGFATIALRHAAAISPAYVDTVRAASASSLAAAASALALPMVRAIRDPGLRSSAAAAAASESPSGEEVLAFADAADSTWARDVIYSVATTRLVGQRRSNSVVGIARRIKSPTLRGVALVAIAAAIVDARPGAARALRAEALPLLDPSEQTGRPPTVPDLAPALRQFVAVGEHRRLQAWAESQPTPQRRALAFLLILEGATVGGESTVVATDEDSVLPSDRPVRRGRSAPLTKPVTDPTPPRPLADWIADAKAAIAAAPEHNEERLSRLIAALVRAGRIDGAREVARTLARSYGSLSHVIHHDLVRGDIDAALVTADRATVGDRGRLQVWIVAATDSTGATAMLDQAGALAQADTAAWARQLWTSVVLARVTLGDLGAGFRWIAGAEDIAERASRIASVSYTLRQTGREHLRRNADSLALLALGLTSEIRDSVKRRQVRSQLEPKSMAAAMPQAWTPEQQRLDTQVASGDSVAAIAALSEFARRGEVRRGVDAAIRRLPGYMSSDALDPNVVAIAHAAVRYAASASPLLADSTRHRIVIALMRLELVDSTGGFDDIFASIVNDFNEKDPRRALALARRLRHPTSRAYALIRVAAGQSDPRAGWAIATEALSAVDPADPAFGGATLLPLLGTGEAERLRDWAAKQPTAARRAGAFLAIIEALAGPVRPR